MERKVGEESVSAVATGDNCCRDVQLNGDGVYLNYRQLQSLPPRLFDRDMAAIIHCLYLKHNLLSSLPPEIKLLQNLTELYIGCNSLKTLPEEVGELMQLQILGLSDNQLTELPQFVCGLKNLRRLQLSKNHVTHIPPEIGDLTLLQSLEVSHNRLRQVPSQIRNCLQLRQLCVDSNQLTSLPRELCQLQNLSEISACDNLLVSLPQDLGRVASLQSVYVDNNPYLTAVPASTLNKSLGFCGSGKGTVPEKLLSSQLHITLENSEEGDVPVLMPPEVRSLGLMNTNCVPPLLEITLRVVFRGVQTSELKPGQEDLPSDLTTLLNTPTAHCQNCSGEIFSAAFPVVFRGQVKTNNLLLLGLCCSSACVRQSSLAVHLPLLYPRLEDLALALVLV